MGHFVGSVAVDGRLNLASRTFLVSAATHKTQLEMRVLFISLDIFELPPLNLLNNSIG